MRHAKRISGQEVGTDYDRLETIWRDPATPTYAAKADAVMKLYANGSGVIPKEYARIEMGFSDEQRRDMREWDKEDEPSLDSRSEEHTSELQSREKLVCRLLLEKKKQSGVHQV